MVRDGRWLDRMLEGFFKVQSFTGLLYGPYIHMHMAMIPLIDDLANSSEAGDTLGRSVLDTSTQSPGLKCPLRSLPPILCNSRLRPDVLLLPHSGAGVHQEIECAPH